MSRLLLAWLAVATTGCLQADLVICDDGYACATTHVCAPAGGGCVTPQQVEACAELADGEACTLAGSGRASCRARVCSVATCGDGVLDPGEVCDDGNNLSGDGCNGTCTSTEICGNGIVEFAEECDCGTAEHPGSVACGDTYNGGPRCNLDCTLRPRCGNGVLDPGEVCDDGNVVSLDGCSSDCRSDETCGNGVRDVGEECDDGNNLNHDGCQSNCLVQRCGDGITDPGEQCDDANFINTDACLVSCRWATCGDGIVHEGVELCDDANGNNYDGCTDQCLPCGSDYGQQVTAFDASSVSCFVGFGEPQSFDDAEARCVELGGHLARIDNFGNNAIVTGFAQAPELWEHLGYADPVWIGAHYDIDLRELRWTDGTSFVPNISFNGWGEPIEVVYRSYEAGEVGACTMMTEEGLWQGEDCDMEHVFACRLPSSTWD